MADSIHIDPVEPWATSSHNDTRAETESEKTVHLEQAPSTLPKLDDPPPDGGYGWVCVACNFFINGVFFETLSLIGASFAHQKYQIILAQGVCFGWGMGFLFVGSVGIIAQWFGKKRSVANSIAAAGSGAGGLLYSLVTQRIIDTLGLPWAFRILGICTFAVNLTASNLLRDRNKQTGSRHKAFDTKILRRPEFLLIQGWSWFSMLGYTILLFSLPAYARAIGLSAKQGSVLNAILNLGQMVGRPFIGLSSDRWGRLNNATFFTLLCGVVCFALWIPAEVVPSPMVLLSFFAVVGGALAGTFWTTIAPVAAEVLGLQDLPAGLSLTWVLMVPPTTCAEAIALELRRQDSDRWIYLPPQIFTSFMYIAAGVCIWLVRGWKVGELQWRDREMRERERKGRQQRIWTDDKTAAPVDGEKVAIQGEQCPDGDETEVNRDPRSMRRDIWRLRNLLKNMLTWKVV
ncbi:uncharacterized protein Z518_11044 [Rhinocladiella mackenziei CBS 650.93]|uniref:Major facilitator superfamily (MFS) profile domain-containing protein n=1 Tax=Rhinocladiella mackenziei CBS 650.93 TaxID=1442369 RepID=A0A0D2FBZ3_9EURO|nr:uncharacterized protein Z518_11044 [Rhinocladiella mackenziei CBS 650.93]KIW99631.1 hypothetical protein Z518_11044 [Rhinocladiella mackenziei CBS 650.93]